MKDAFGHAARCGLAALAIAASGTPAAADVEAFYRDKTVAIVIGTAPGGSYDLYGRTIAAHLGKHIPGKPSVSVEFMPGAGSAVAGNYVYGIGPQDGTKIVLPNALPMMERLHGGSGIRFESPDRVAALRKAFDELMKDADFLADAEKRKLAISPRNAAAVTDLVRTVMTTPPEQVARIKDVLGIEQ
jgi:tripartite-type tricarboxylate transporter receptor subunit TctC